MEFDELSTAPCTPGNANAETDGVNPSTCQPTGSDPSDDNDPPPSTDDRCADPGFYAAHPEICAGYPVLILKPEYSLIESGKTVQYRTFLRAAGDEVEITTGLTYDIADNNIGTIDTDGLLTGSAPGITTVSVAWQNRTAHAQLEVTEACSAINTDFLILIDNSLSSTAGFSGAYSSRLSFAKEAARGFADTVNYDKDRVGVAYFNSSGSIVLEMSSDKSEIKAAIAGITSTTARTDLAAGMDAAMDYLNTQDNHKVLILLTDGESNQGEDPLLLAQQWKDANKTIIVVALRSWGQYFNTLYQIASAGFFLSAYDDTAADCIDTLKGLKTYLCSGDCQPAAGTYPTAQLNYSDFENWDVFQGQVDLIGLGTWDVQPGNGLYLDMAGTKGIGGFNSADQIEPGGIKSKELFTIETGKTYRFSIDVGGNNVRRPADNASVRCRIMNDDTTFLDYTITPTSDEMPLTQYQYEFTAEEDGEAWIQIEMLEDSVKDFPNVGPLIDDVIFENLTDDTVLLSDDFNNENLTEIPDGLSYYGPCLDTPPGAQSADPTPPEVLET